MEFPIGAMRYSLIIEPSASYFMCNLQIPLGDTA